MTSARGIILRELYVSLAAVGELLLLLGVLGGLLKERTPISEPLIALLAGVLIGPAALLRRLLPEGDWHRVSVDRRQPRHLRLCVRPRDNRHAPHQALREAVLRRVGWSASP